MFTTLFVFFLAIVSIEKIYMYQTLKTVFDHNFQTPQRWSKVVFSVFRNIVKHSLCLIYHLRLESLKRKSNTKISASSIYKVSKVKLQPCILESKGKCWPSKRCLSEIYKPRLLGLLTSRLWHSYRGYMAHQVFIFLSIFSIKTQKMTKQKVLFYRVMLKE